MKARVLLVLGILIVSLYPAKAGWSYHAHENYLKESVTILNYFDYKMCMTYKEDLLKGMMEGEMQFKYRLNGKSPLWLGEISQQELSFVQGFEINMENIDTATEFFYKRINSLRNDIIEMRRPYSEVMFELGYILHSINNILIPLYEEGHFPEQQLASNTENLELSISETDKIVDLKTWLQNMLSEKIQIRNTWTNFANINDRDGFIEYAKVANQKNIYTISYILVYVTNNTYGPTFNLDFRTRLEKIEDNKVEKINGRKPWK